MANVSEKCKAARDAGFSYGTIHALAVLTSMGDAGSTAYCEILRGAGEAKVLAEARKQRAMRWAGLDRYLRQSNANAKYTYRKPTP